MSLCISRLLASGLLGFEPQLLSHRLPVKVYVFGADLLDARCREHAEQERLEHQPPSQPLFLRFRPGLLSLRSSLSFA